MFAPPRRGPANAGWGGMRPTDIRRLWAASGRVATGKGSRGLMARLRIMRAGWHHREALGTLLHAPAHGLLARLVGERPEFLAFAEAPYLCAGWDTPTRIAHFARHAATAESLGGMFAMAVDEGVELLDLAEIRPGYHVVLDKPMWFHREGQFALNLFRDNLRLFSLSFAVTRAEAGLTAMIGGIQGRNLDGMLDEYRIVTKAAEGLRPRDLLIELFRMLCRAVGVAEIYAVSDAARHHRSPYFGKDTGRPLPLDYDAIWEERGGERIDRDFFSLPIARQSRDPADIPARKRAMYRKRYELLDRLEAAMAAGIKDAKPARRPEAE